MTIEKVQGKINMYMKTSCSLKPWCMPDLDSNFTGCVTSAGHLTSLCMGIFTGKMGRITSNVYLTKLL